MPPSLQGQAEGLDRSSNFGQLDILAALAWTQRNIAAFGGNLTTLPFLAKAPAAITCMRCWHRPSQTACFIGPSPSRGTPPRSPPGKPTTGSEISPDRPWRLGLTGALGLAADDASAAALRDVPAYDLLEAYYDLDKDHLSPLSTADGIVIPLQGIDGALADPEFAKSIPVLSGSNRDEVTLWLGLNRYFVNGDEVLFGLLPPRMSLKDREMYRYWVDLRSRGWKARGVDGPMLNLAMAVFRSVCLSL